MQLTRGMDKTVAALVKELAKLSTEVANDKDLANVAAVSAGERERVGTGKGARDGRGERGPGESGFRDAEAQGEGGGL